MTLSGQEIWVGDDAGRIYILDADTLQPLEKDGSVIEMETENKKGVYSITASSSFVAVGGVDGIITVFDL
jgi:hypothetical protein